MDEYELENGLVIRSGSFVTLCDDFEASEGSWVGVCEGMVAYEGETVEIKHIYTGACDIRRRWFTIVGDDSGCVYGNQFIVAVDGDQPIQREPADYFKELENKGGQF